MTKRILIVAGGGIALLLVAWIFMATAFKGASVDTASLITIMQQQTELARISEEATKDAQQQATVNFAVTTQYSMGSSRSQLLNFLSQNGKKVDEKTLSLTQSSQTDSALAEADASGTYDSVYLDLAQKQLASYNKAVQNAFANSGSTTERQLLSDAHTQAQLLYEQSKSR